MTQKHIQVLFLIGLRLIKEKCLKKYGTVLRRIFEARETSDYEIYAVFEKEEIKEFLKQAKSLKPNSETRLNVFLRHTQQNSTHSFCSIKKRFF